MPMLKSMRIIFHGYEHAQYFQGHGVSFTRYTDCATGAGQSHYGALDDCLDQLASSFDLDAIGLTDERIRAEVLAETGKTLEALEEQDDYADMHSDCPEDESEPNSPTISRIGSASFGVPLAT